MYKTKVVNGQTVPDWDFVCFYKGTLSGTTLSDLTLVWSSTGSDQTFGIGDTVDLSYTSGWGEDLYSALSTHLDQDGTLKADAVDVTAVIKDAIITRPKLASAFATEFTQGWVTGDLPAVSTVTANGNRSYTLGFASDVSATLSEGMRLRTTRTVASTQNAFSLDGSNDYYNKTSPSGMTFTDDFSVSAWVYMTAYGANKIVSRANGTQGWIFDTNSSGQVVLRGFNAALSNYKGVQSYQSIPLNKWVHVTAQIDMNTATTTTTTNYVMIDGVSVPCQVTQGGTNPTTLVQAGNLEIGSYNSGTDPFPGYLDQVAIYSAKVPQATHLAAMHQGLTGSETSLISAYANGSTTDLNTSNANNLSAQNGATTVASAPWGNRGLSTTLDYALVMSVSGSNVTVQVPEGCTIPTTGGVTSVAYSTQANPYGFVSDKGRWEVQSKLLTSNTTSSNANYGSFISGGWALTVPIGSWNVGWCAEIENQTTTAVAFNISSTSLSGLSVAAGNTTSPFAVRAVSSAAATYAIYSFIEEYQSISVASTYVMYTVGATTGAAVRGDIGKTKIFAVPSTL